MSRIFGASAIMRCCRPGSKLYVAKLVEGQALRFSAHSITFLLSGADI
jgi:hypothetical protein